MASAKWWAVAALGACTMVQDPAVPMVRAHAHRDLVCPDEEIHVEPRTGGQYAAYGCGRKALYHSACEGLKCTVGVAGEEPASWRDRPEPDSVHDPR